MCVFRLALLLTQLYIDRRAKSVWGSIVNVLGRNRQLCVRMPRFRDSRKMRQGQARLFRRVFFCFVLDVSTIIRRVASRS